MLTREELEQIRADDNPAKDNLVSLLLAHIDEQEAEIGRLRIDSTDDLRPGMTARVEPPRD